MKKTIIPILIVASVVNLFGMAGPAMAQTVTVPDVVGWEQADAVDAMVSRGLKVSETYSPSDTVDAGYVISQDPVGGTVVFPGSNVTLTISTGPENVEVPDVVGDSETDADSAIISAGLTVSHTYQNSETVAAGYVISQSRRGGTTVPNGSLVVLTISLGPEMVTVPDVVGDHYLTDAGPAIEAVGLMVSYTYEHGNLFKLGHVISQVPVAGTAAPFGSVVTLTVSLGPDGS